MPRFSAFWLTHYKEIGNCCMTAPLKKLKVRNNVKVEVPDKFQSLQLVEDYIDTGWMDQKKLKWIGWDIQGWYAWTDPNGMLYRIKDLQRNEDGREYEKEVEEIVASGDPRTHQGNPTAKELYTFERDMQRNCGFCPDGSGGSDGSDAEQEGGKKDDTKKENIADDIDLDGIMQGKIPDFMPGDDEYVPKAPVTDTTEVTETGHINDNPYMPTPGGADDGSGIVKEIIDDLPILPPTPMPTNKQNPVLNTTKVTDTSKVATPAQNPFQQKMAEQQKAHEERIKTKYKWDGTPKPTPGIPASVPANKDAIYDPKSRSKFLISPLQPIRPIYERKPKKQEPGLNEREKEINDLILDIAGTVSKDDDDVNNSKTLIDLTSTFDEYIKAKWALEEAKRWNNKLEIQDAEIDLIEKENELIKTVVATSVGILAAPQVLAIKVLNEIDQLFEEKPGYIKEKIRNLQEELKTQNEPIRRGHILREIVRLNHKLNEINRKIK